MTKVEVAIIASDQIRKSGAVNLLASRSDIHILADQERAESDVMVMIEPVVTDVSIARLRQACAGRTRATPPPCVVVTDDVHDKCLLPGVAAGVVEILPLTRINKELLIASVLDARKLHTPLRYQVNSR